MNKFLLVIIALFGGYALAWYTKPAEVQKDFFPWTNNQNTQSIWSQITALFDDNKEIFRFENVDDSLTYVNAVHLFKLKEYKSADSLFDVLLLKYYNFDSLYIFAARNKLNLGNTDDAQYYYLQALDIFDENALLYTEYAHYLNSMLLYYDADYYAQEALSLDQNLKEAYFELAYSYLYSGYYDLSIEKLEEGLLIDSVFAPFYYMKALVFDEKNDFDNAIHYYSLAIKYDPEYVEAINALGYLNFKFEYFYEAIKWFKLAISKNSPINYHINMNTALAFSKIDKPDSAFHYFAESIKIKPDNFQVYLTRGYYAYQLERYAQAIEDFNKVIELDSQNAHAYIYRGASYYAQGKFVEALNDYYSAFEYEPLNEDVIYNLAITHDQLSNTSDAIQMYQKYIELGTDSICLAYSNNRIVELNAKVN